LSYTPALTGCLLPTASCAGMRGRPAIQRAARGRSSKSPYSRILVTTPEPTVRPPSRMANRTFSSMAMGLINSTASFTLSPGMHISAPPNRLSEPVTSVVRK